MEHDHEYAKALERGKCLLFFNSIDCKDCVVGTNFLNLEQGMMCAEARALSDEREVLKLSQV